MLRILLIFPNIISFLCQHSENLCCYLDSLILFKLFGGVIEDSGKTLRVFS